MKFCLTSMGKCRLCLGAWSDHGERTGGFYACNRYEAAKQEGAVSVLISSVILDLPNVLW
jgi:hypothetical protein